MKHLLISREYPPAPRGGIGTYMRHMAEALATQGDTVHVISQRWAGAEQPAETLLDGRLTIHRLPFTAPHAIFGIRRHPAMSDPGARRLFASILPSQAFSWQAAGLAERLMEEHTFDAIEGPEYEAPLYFLQHRRSLGIGPAVQTPVIVHLHSPSMLIARHNGWDTGLPSVRHADRLERLSVLAADAVLAPSRFLAHQVAEMYGLGDHDITVIPYPLDPRTGVIERDPNTWSSGTILYMGRLEPRKGIEEWLAAAVRVAATNSRATFVLVGRDHLRPPAHTRIPRALRRQFILHDHQPRAVLERLLADARVVVVPSRWENFPYTCMEAMASGVGVLASPHGGMAEMIEDGRSGWVSESSSAPDLESALNTILALQPEALRDAGLAAATRIRAMCGEASVIARQRAWRSQLTVARPAGRASELTWLAQRELEQPGDGRDFRGALREGLASPIATATELVGRVARRAAAHLGRP